MRALISVSTGGPETLLVGHMATPVPIKGEISVRVAACAINYPDLLIIADRYQLKPKRPFAPGGEIAGVVDSVGPGVTQWRVGDRIIGFNGYGGLAESVVILASQAYELPPGRSFTEGAALLFTYGTALHGLRDRGRMATGNRVLVLGAAGGVGRAAVQLGKALGAHVIGAVSSAEKARVALSAGADETLVYPHEPLEGQAARELALSFKVAGGAAGFDIVFDTVGGDYAQAAIRSMAWGGRYLVVGFPAGIPRIPLNLPLLKGCDICGVFWGSFAERDRKACAAQVAMLFDLWRQGRIAPSADHVLPLERGGEAIAMLADRDHIGKIVISIDGGAGTDEKLRVDRQSI